MDFELTEDEIYTVYKILKEKHLKISIHEIRDQFNKIEHSQQVFPLSQQRTLLIQLLNNYEKTKKKEVIILDKLKGNDYPITVILGALAEDWPGMSNAVLGIIHHDARNVLYIKGFTIEFRNRLLGVVILSFQINTLQEYNQFLEEEKELISKIKVAARGSADKVLLLKDESIKFEIYSKVISYLPRIYHADDIGYIIGENWEALKFVSSRSREYLEERKIADLAKLIIDNHCFQKQVSHNQAAARIKISNFKTRYEELTGITFVCKKERFSIEDFLETLKFIVPDHHIKHQKSFISKDDLLVYRIEIVDKNNNQISPGLIKSIRKSFEKLIVPAYGECFSQIKSVGGFEHYARAIIPFLMEELRRTELTQVFINADSKTDFSIQIKLIIVSHKTKKNTLPTLISSLGKLPGIQIRSVIPSKLYGKKIELNILKLYIRLAEFTSINQVYDVIKGVLRKLYGKIRDFDEGLREIEIKILNQLLDKLSDVNSSLIKEIFFNLDELYRVENSAQLLEKVIRLCDRAIKESDTDINRLIIKCENLKELRRSLLVVSFLQPKKIISKLIKELKGVDICFTRITWNQRTYIIMILSQKGEAMKTKFLRDIARRIEGFYK